MKLQVKKYSTLIGITSILLILITLGSFYFFEQERSQFFEKYSFVFDFIKKNEKFEGQYKFIGRDEVEELCEEGEGKQMISKDVCLFRINALMNCNIGTREISTGRGRFPKVITKTSTINLFSFEETMKISKNVNTQEESDTISKKCRESMTKNEEKHNQLIDEISNSKTETGNILTGNILTGDTQTL